MIGSPLFSSKKGNFWAIFFSMIGFICLTFIYIAFTPMYEKMLEVGRELITDSTALGILSMMEMIWTYAWIPGVMISIGIYMLVSGLRKEPYQY